MGCIETKTKNKKYIETTSINNIYGSCVLRGEHQDN